MHDFLNLDSKDAMPNMQHNLNMQFRDAMEDLNSMKLSPNLKILNKHLAATKDRIAFADPKNSTIMTNGRNSRAFGQRAQSMTMTMNSLTPH